VNNSPAGSYFASNEHVLGMFSTTTGSHYLEMYAISSCTNSIGVQFFIFYTMYEMDDYYPKYLCHYAATEVYDNARTRPPNHMTYERE